MADALEHLSLLDISDREILLMIRDLCAESMDGYCASSELADHMGLIGSHPTRTVANRLSWMARFGTVEREYLRDSQGNIRYHRNGKVWHTQRWCLTDLGLQMATGKLTKTQEASLDKLGAGQALMAMRWFTQRVTGDGQIGRLLDREYRHGTQRR